MAENTVVGTLNEFLRGQYMGIHQYEHHIEKMEDIKIKQLFREFQQDHKIHAQRVADRIKELGGTPVDNEGILASIQSNMSKWKIPDTTEGIIESALKGENQYGIGMSEEIVRGDLDQESHHLIEEILNKDREHVDKLRNLLH